MDKILLTTEMVEEANKLLIDFKPAFIKNIKNINRSSNNILDVLDISDEDKKKIEKALKIKLAAKILS